MKQCLGVTTVNSAELAHTLVVTRSLWEARMGCGRGGGDGGIMAWHPQASLQAVVKEEAESWGRSYRVLTDTEDSDTWNI